MVIRIMALLSCRLKNVRPIVGCAVLIFLFLACTALPGGSGVYASERIAVVRSKFDPVERVLDSMKIRYDMIGYRDLENIGAMKKYGVIFFPCGMDHPLERNVNVLSRGNNIQSVALKEDIYEPDEDKIADNVRDFVRSGGCAYFSGYSFDILDKAFDVFEFHDDFPYMGLPGRIESTLEGDLARFAMKNVMALYMGHPGWISVRSVNGAEVIARAAYETPRGHKEGPISCMRHSGSGFFLYTVYHDTVYSDFRRFNVYRVVGGGLVDSLESRADRWGQQITGRIADALQGNENCRTYMVDLREGTNGIYFKAARGSYQVDVLDRSFSLIESRDTNELLYEFVIHADRDETGYVRVFPATGERHVLYSIVAGHGVRVFPYFFSILWGAALLAAAAGIVFLIITFSRRGYSALGRRI